MSSMNNLSKDGEFRYIIQWFKEWSELQREDFVPVLVDYLTQDPSGNAAADDVYMNGLVNTVLGVELNDKPMSLFQCRIKLFRQWSRKWPADFKHKLQEKIYEIDTKVGDKIINEIKTQNGFDGNDTRNGIDDSNVNGNANETGIVAATDDVSVIGGASVALTPRESADNQRLIDASTVVVLNAETPPSAGDSVAASTTIIVGDASTQPEPAEQVQVQAQENGTVVVVVTGVDVDAGADAAATAAVTAQTVANNAAEVSLVP